MLFGFFTLTTSINLLNDIANLKFSLLRKIYQEGDDTKKVMDTCIDLSV